MTWFAEEENDEESWVKFEGLYYWMDENHIGCLWVTDEIFKKYKLDEDAETLNEYYDDEPEYLEELKAVAPHRNYTHAILIDHCDGVSKTNDTEGFRTSSIETPQGQCRSKEFVAWWLGIDIRLFDEPEENVWLISWSDG